MDSTMSIFPGRSIDADSTVMPQARAWVKDVSSEVGNCASDHNIVLFLNLPCVGIGPSTKLEFFVTFVANTLADYKHNAIAILVHPNRAGQAAQRTVLW